jgi:Fe-S oxidoreductase
VFVEELTRDVKPIPGVPTQGTVTYHDPCYLGRYAATVDEPRALLARAGATIAEPVRTKENPFCCGAGGGLLFEEHEAGQRISEARYQQLAATGADTIVMACPFCSIMLKGAQASAAAGGKTMAMTDLMSYVADRLPGARGDGSGS